MLWLLQMANFLVPITCCQVGNVCVSGERECVQILNIFAGHLKQPVDLGTTGDQLQSLCCSLQTVQD